MGKAVLISIKPEWVAKILNGEKTIEVRKTAPKCELPIEVYIYCTKGERTLRRNIINGYSDFYIEKGYGDVDLNGKVVAKFTLRKVDYYIAGNNMDEDHQIGGNAFIIDGVLDKACLTEKQLLKYTEHNNKNPYDFTFYVWRISNLQIFDEPKEISEFKYEKKKVRLTEKYHWKTERLGLVQVKKAPQSWQYVEVQL